jgi:hypothetical protein
MPRGDDHHVAACPDKNRDRMLVNADAALVVQQLGHR